MQTPRSILPVALVSGVIGGALVVGAGALFDIGGADKTTTVVQQAPLATADASQKGGGPLTAREIYKRDAPGVAFITAQIVQRTSSPFDFGIPQEQQGTATGSGFVLDKDGTIATNAHVVDGATKVSVRFGDGAAHTAKILGVDKSTDLALLKIDPKGVEPAAAGARLLARPAGRRPDDRDRQPVRPRPHADDRRRVARCSARSRRPTASRSTTSSRPTPRSTPATRAARCSTRPAASSGSTPRSRPAAAATATSASASRSRSTRSSRSSTTSRRRAPSRTPTSA